MNIKAILEQKREDIFRLAAQNTALLMSAFLALLSAGKKSRIAILICWLNWNRIAVFLIWEVFRRSYKELQSLLGCDVDIVTEKGLHWYIRDQVINEARQL